MPFSRLVFTLSEIGSPCSFKHSRDLLWCSNLNGIVLAAVLSTDVVGSRESSLEAAVVIVVRHDGPHGNAGNAEKWQDSETG